MKQGWVSDNFGTYHYVDGIIHNDNGPAIIINGGTKYWYKHGLWHREDGPAIEYADGTKSWYINDKNIAHSHQEFEAWKRFRAFI